MNYTLSVQTLFLLNEYDENCRYNEEYLLVILTPNLLFHFIKL